MDNLNVNDNAEQSVPTKKRQRESSSSNSIWDKLLQLQSELKVPKNIVNQKSGFSYRSAEGIIEAVKPALNRLGLFLVFRDEIISLNGQLFFKSNCVISDGKNEISTCGYAQFNMSSLSHSICQDTGACCTYAHKYALNALFALDDAKTDTQYAKDPDYSNIEALSPVVPASSDANSEPAKPANDVKEKKTVVKVDEKPNEAPADKAKTEASSGEKNTLSWKQRLDENISNDKQELTPSSAVWGRYVVATAKYTGEDVEGLIDKINEKAHISSSNLVILLQQAGREALLG